VSLNTKKDDTLDEKFLSSFVLPERQMEKPKTSASANGDQAGNAEDPAVQRPANNETNRPAEGEGEVKPGAENNQEQNTPNVAANQQQNQGPNQKRGPISGGMLNGKAIYLPVPEVPAGEATGVVLVAVVIDEQGTVIEARAISGPQHLHAAAVSAARLARFSATLLMGEPVRVSGTLSYNFVRSN
jgi:protein TonB